MVDATLAQLVARAAQAIFGRFWRRPLADALELNIRTVRKIGRAAQMAEHFPISPGVLTALAKLMRDHAADVDTGSLDAESCGCLAAELTEAARVWKPTKRSG